MSGRRSDATRVLRDQEEKNSEKERKKRINAAPKKYYYRWMIKSKCRAYRIYPPLSAIARDECSIRDGIITWTVIQVRYAGPESFRGSCTAAVVATVA